MTMKDIRTAWNQGATKGNSPAHKNFPDQMAIRTVMNRAIKIEVASSNDSHLDFDESNKHEDVNPIEIEQIEEVKESREIPKNDSIEAFENEGQKNEYQKAVTPKF